MRRIVLTGGGTAGHVIPNIALIPYLKQTGYDISYIGSKDGIEKQIVEAAKIPYYAISTGKFRRYFDIKNVTDPFRVVVGMGEAYGALRKLKPDIVFSKGGFVSGPVVIAAKLLSVPSIIHESDMTPGLANRLSMPFVTKICYTFPETKEHINDKKSVFTGTPVRGELLEGSSSKGRQLCSFTGKKPVLMIIGGSHGSEVINTAVRSALPELLSRFDICHICGRGKVDGSKKSITGYKQFEFVTSELPHLFAAADVVVSRAGANTIFEILALKKPNLLIPLSRRASRGDQILNAVSFQRQRFSDVLFEEDLTPSSLVNHVSGVYNNRKIFIDEMGRSQAADGIGNIMKVIADVASKRK